MTRTDRARWQRLARIERTPWVTVQWLVASTVGFFAFAYAFGTILAHRQSRPLQPIIVGVPEPGSLVLTLAVLVGSIVVVVALHEVIHGVFLAQYGGEPTYGVGTTTFGLPYAYATVTTASDDERKTTSGDGSTASGDERKTTSGDGSTALSGGRKTASGDERKTTSANGSTALSGGQETANVRVKSQKTDTGPDGTEWGYARNELLVVLLAPFVVISSFGVVALTQFPSPVLVVVLAANAAGSVADLWMAGSLLRYPSAVRVGGLSDTTGVGIYGPRGDGGENRVHSVVARVSRGALGTYAALVGVFGALVLTSVAFGSGTVVLDCFGRSVLRHEFYPDQGVVLLSSDVSWVVGLSIVGGVCWAAVLGIGRWLRRSIA